MEKIVNQLTLGLYLKDEATFENFYPGKNAELISILKKTIKAQGEKIVYITGKQSQGSSHLLHACCHFAHTVNTSSIYLPLTDVLSLSPEFLLGIEALTLVCIDDLHKVVGLREWEEALFHLFNRVYDAGGKMVFAARDIPKALNFTLPDLVSRLSWGVIYPLHGLTDEEKLSALIMRAFRRGIHLSEEVGKYILTHCPRHMGTLFAALDALDKASLAAQRRLTIPFVKEILLI